MAGVAGAGLAGVGSASASGGRVFRAGVSCTKRGGGIGSVSNGRTEIRDTDGEGLNGIDGRPELEPGETLTLETVPDGEVVLRAYKPRTNKALTGKRTYGVECKRRPKPECRHQLPRQLPSRSGGA